MLIVVGGDDFAVSAPYLSTFQVTLVVVVIMTTKHIMTTMMTKKGIRLYIEGNIKTRTCHPSSPN